MLSCRLCYWLSIIIESCCRDHDCMLLLVLLVVTIRLRVTLIFIYLFIVIIYLSLFEEIILSTEQYAVSMSAILC